MNRCALDAAATNPAIEQPLPSPLGGIRTGVER